MADGFRLSDDLWTPQRRGIEETIALLERGKDVCLYGPTGSGKTRCAIELFRWAEWKGFGGCFYVNRKLLVGQTADRFRQAGLEYGIRSADYEDQYRLDAPFQICSADTEGSRVCKKKIWNVHPSGVVVIDEAHIQRTDTMRWLMILHRDHGARFVLLTATPIGLSKWADELVISGKLQEYRDCKALVPAKVFTIEQPDLSKVKRNATGEYMLDGQKKKIYTQSIVGNVIDAWKTYNPDARPTMLYAPGKPESVWLTEQFMKQGVNWCHVDATDAVVDGERYTLNRPLWDDILGRYKAGEIKGLSSRFKLREGIDVPSTYHCILATPIGSLASYLQTVGRVLRYSPETPDHVIVTDHGGSYVNHGSPNHDRDWREWWRLPEHVVSTMHVNQIRDGEIAEPIRCPKCGMERTSGRKCPHCSFEHEKSKRHVLMENGELVEKDGNLIARRRVKMQSDTEAKWSKMFWGYRNKKVEKSFAQMYAFFTHEYGYSPPRDLPYMPKERTMWFSPPHAVPMDQLHSKREVAAG